MSLVDYRIFDSHKNENASPHSLYVANSGDIMRFL